VGNETLRSRKVKGNIGWMEWVNSRPQWQRVRSEGSQVVLPFDVLQRYLHLSSSCLLM